MLSHFWNELLTIDILLLNYKIQQAVQALKKDVEVCYVTWEAADERHVQASRTADPTFKTKWLLIRLGNAAHLSGQRSQTADLPTCFACSAVFTFLNLIANIEKPEITHMEFQISSFLIHISENFTELTSHFCWK